MAAAKIDDDDMPYCPICLEQFNKPRQLLCAYSFCESCLQSHVSTKTANYKELRSVQCPVCGNYTTPSVTDKPTSEWASLFPANIVLQSILPTKSKVDRICDACKSEGVSVPANGFCAVCKEAMCEDCSKVHRKQKISKDHTILSVEELASNPEHVLKLAEGFTCSEHDGEDIKYYCKDHSVPCCSTCFFRIHTIYYKVVDLKEELPALLNDSKPDEIIADTEKIETHLKKFMEMNESGVNNLESQVNAMTDQIREVRKKINSILDELEKRLKIEGNRMYKEEVVRKQEENHQCLALIHAVRNSHYLLEAVDTYGSNIHKFLMAEKMKSHLHSYFNQVREKYEKTDTIRLDVEFTPPIQSILSLSLSKVGKIVTATSSKTLSPICLRRPTKVSRVENVDVIGLGNGCYYVVTFLPGDRVMLTDYNSKQCILISSSYQFITSHTLAYRPWSICVLDDDKVAVAVCDHNIIQILSVVGDVIRSVVIIRTNYSCCGIAAAGNGEIFVNGDCDNDKNESNLINTRGDIKYSHLYDCTYNISNCVAANNMKTRLYVGEYDTDSLLCFDMDGRNQFTYSPDNLRDTHGVAVDRYDNIYIIGSSSHNIHHMSPNGSVLQVIASGLPEYPCAICINSSKDILIITNDSDKNQLHIYQLN